MAFSNTIKIDKSTKEVVDQLTEKQHQLYYSNNMPHDACAYKSYNEFQKAVEKYHIEVNNVHIEVMRDNDHLYKVKVDKLEKGLKMIYANFLDGLLQIQTLLARATNIPFNVKNEEKERNVNSLNSRLLKATYDLL